MHNVHMNNAEVPPRVHARCSELLGHAEELARQGMAKNPTLLTYANELIDWEEQIAAGARSVRFILATIGGIEAEIDERFPKYLGQDRAERGVPVDELLRAVNVDFEMCWTALTSVEAGLDHDDLLALGSYVWRAIEQYSNSVLFSYHEREQRLRRARRLRTDGTIASFLARSKHRDGAVVTSLEAIGFELSRDIVVFATADSAEEVERRMALRDPVGALRISSLPEGTFALWQPNSRSHSLDALEGEEAIWEVPDHPERIPVALQALRDALGAVPQVSGLTALEDTWMDQLAFHASEKHGYILHRRLRAYHQLTPAARERVREVVDAISRTTSLTEASRFLHVHRNTLVQRCAQITERTGFDLRVPREANELRLLLRAADLARDDQSVPGY